MMNSNNFNKPFNPCGNCPHNQNGAPIQNKTKYIVQDNYNHERHLIELTDEQIRFLQWCKDECLFNDDVSFDEVDNAEWEEI